MHYQLTIQRSLDQRFLINFLLIFNKNYAPDAVFPEIFSEFRFSLSAFLNPPPLRIRLWALSCTASSGRCHIASKSRQTDSTLSPA
jgi:hypothetical protein